MIDNNENKSMCAGCGGKCCKKLAGFYHPEQVLDLIKNIAADVRLGVTHQVDCLDRTADTDYNDVFMVRPCHTNSTGETVDRSWGGTCVNLGQNGCKFAFEERPKMCQDLVPSLPISCASGTDKYAMAEIWKPYQHYFEPLFS